MLKMDRKDSMKHIFMYLVYLQNKNIFKDPNVFHFY